MIVDSVFLSSSNITSFYYFTRQYNNQPPKDTFQMPDQLSHRPAHQEGGQLGHRPSHAGANLDHRPAYTCLTYHHTYHPLEEAGETSGELGSEELLLLLLDQDWSHRRGEISSTEKV